MTVGQLKEIGLYQLDEQGNQIKLSAYKQKKLLL